MTAAVPAVKNLLVSTKLLYATLLQDTAHCWAVLPAAIHSQFAVTTWASCVSLGALGQAHQGWPRPLPWRSAAPSCALRCLKSAAEPGQGATGSRQKCCKALDLYTAAGLRQELLPDANKELRQLPEVPAGGSNTVNSTVKPCFAQKVLPDADKELWEYSEHPLKVNIGIQH